MNGTLLQRIEQAKAAQSSKSPLKPVAKYRNGQPKPQWLLRAEEVGHVVKEFKA